MPTTELYFMSTYFISHKIHRYNVNFFVTRHLGFEGKNEPFIFENGSNLTHDNFKQEN